LLSVHRATFRGRYSSLLIHRFALRLARFSFIISRFALCAPHSLFRASPLPFIVERSSSIIHRLFFLFSEIFTAPA
jgi:hypothetical protein